MQTKHLCVLIHIRIKGKVGTMKLIYAPQYLSYWPSLGDGSLVDLICD